MSRQLRLQLKAEPDGYKVVKLWGAEYWHHNSLDYCMKTLVVKHGFMSSMHCHHEKKETFLVVSGSILLEHGSIAETLSAGQSVTIDREVFHRFRSLTNVSTVIEASTTHRDDDVYRKEESRRYE